ncbi:unnamed protein product, partial [Linum tenue]
RDSNQIALLHGFGKYVLSKPLVCNLFFRWFFPFVEWHHKRIRFTIWSTNKNCLTYDAQYKGINHNQRLKRIIFRIFHFREGLE